MCVHLELMTLMSKVNVLTVTLYAVIMFKGHVLSYSEWTLAQMYIL